MSDPTTTPALTREIRDKRIAIARDVLKQLCREDAPLKMMRGHAFFAGLIPAGIVPSDQLGPCVDLFQKACEICQLGAVLLSKARIFGGVPVVDVTYEKDDEFLTAGSCFLNIKINLSDIFDVGTLVRLESAFEQGVIRQRDVLGVCSAVHFGYSSATPESAVRACMNYLIAHDGEFNPREGERAMDWVEWRESEGEVRA